MDYRIPARDCNGDACTATVAVGGMVELEGNASGFTVSPILAWWVQEAHDAGGDDCGYLKLPPASPCPFGYLLYESVTQFPSPATYYAPQAPGTYHVTFEASQFSSFDHLSKTATATITVTPLGPGKRIYDWTPVDPDYAHQISS